MKKLFYVFLFLTPILLQRPAFAQFESCGDIQISGAAHCEIWAQEDCLVQCDAANFSVACEGKLKTECEGQCRGDSNVFQCQSDCQTQGNAQCEADLKATCKIQCDEVTGSLFCDGEFIDTTNIEECLEELRNANLSLEVSMHMEHHATASGGCSLNSPSSFHPGAVLFFLALGGMLILRKRKINQAG